MSYQAAHRDDTFLRNKTLHVITPISNPKRYNSRYRLFNEFAAYMGRFPNVQLHPIELAFGERDHVIQHPNAIQVRGNTELWHKENLINIAAKQLPADWKYMAWVDADIQFCRQDWADETLQQLQHYKVIQMFSHALDLGPHYEPLAAIREACIFKIQRDGLPEVKTKENAPDGHPGYAWAIRREAYEGVGGLIDTGIIGSGDRHMSYAMFGYGHLSSPFTMPCAYLDPIMEWQKKADKVICQDVGYMPGLVYHNFHGIKSLRGYGSRWSVISDNDFDPKTDIVRDEQGLWRLAGNKPKLRDQLRNYLTSRHEDSIDV